jgi:phosphate transport system substrate-binding protein
MSIKKKWFSAAAVMIALASVAGCGNPTNNSNQAQGNAQSNTNSNTTGAARTVSTVTLNETGSSLLYPLFTSQWISAFHKVDPNVTISASSTGSGAGIAQAIAGTMDIGASDAYMSNADITANPSMLNIPLAVSAQQVMYHIPSLNTSTHLKLTGPVVAGMYSGTIRYWDDAKIRQLNTGLKLPHQPILLIRRSDSSGDTFLFTQFLNKTSPNWTQFGTSVSWPAVAGEIGAKGNSGIVQALKDNPYSISYVGVSWLDRATASGIGYAALKNKSGKFVLPTYAAIQTAAVTGAKSVPADERVSLINMSGANAYPIINFEYAIVNKQQRDSHVADALKRFLTWAVNPSAGNKSTYLSPVHFLPLPKNVDQMSQKQIAKIVG